MSHERIACLSTEAVETLYLLGAEEKIVGISGFTVYPSRARKEKPKISGFSSARIERILEVKPDLVVGFSELQGAIMLALLEHGIEVHVFNHRDVAGILRMVSTLGALVNRPANAATLVSRLEDEIERAKQFGARRRSKPRVYFEEWSDPMISGTGWVSEIIRLAGGEDCFAELAHRPRAKDRIIADAGEVARRAPDVIVGSWCGKRFKADEVRSRAGWNEIPAVRMGRLYEIKSADILAPGPGAITRGLYQMSRILDQCAP